MRHDPGETLKRGEEEVGLRVVYSPAHHLKREEDEHGEIRSWNDALVFVLFDGGKHSKGCRREDLWLEDHE